MGRALSRRRYAERTHASALLEQWLARLPRGRALDVACGAGRNALRLAAAGFTVDALDISAAALERAATAAVDAGLTIHWIRAISSATSSLRCRSGPSTD